MCLYSPCTDGFAPPVMMPPGIMMPPAMMTPHGMMPLYGAPPAFGPGAASYGPASGKAGGRAGKGFGAGQGKEGVHPESAETKAAVESAARGFIPQSASECLDRSIELMSHAFAKDTYIDPGKFMDDVMTRLKHKKTKDAVRESFSAAAEKLLALRKGADFKALWRQVEIAYADKETSDRVLADMLKDNPTVVAAALASDRGKSLKHACVQEAVSEARKALPGVQALGAPPKPSALRLEVDGKLLEGAKTLEAQGVKHRATVALSFPPPPKREGAEESRQRVVQPVGMAKAEGASRVPKPVNAKASVVKESCHAFCKRAKDWGFREFMSLEQLTDPSAGFVNEGGAITLGVWLQMDA